MATTAESASTSAAGEEGGFTVEPHVEEHTDTEQTPKEQDFCVEILPLIKEAQNQHGLRHGDYQRYRMYCTRRLRRIHRSLHFTQGHRNRYQKKVITTTTVTNVRFLYIPLVCAERAWALAMELKQDTNTEPRKRFHLLRRLTKAAKHAKHFMKLCEECERCDARTRLEAQAYCSWMVGNVKFEEQKWQEALDAFGHSQTIYEKLSGAVTEDQRTLYSQRVEEITPNIRYCAYNIGDMPTDITQLMKLRTDTPGYDMLASKIDLVLAKTQEQVVTSLTEVTWLGKKLPVRSERLKLSLVKLQQVEGELGRVEEGQKKMEMYEQLLMDCQDTMQIVREEISSEMTTAENKRSQKSEQQKANLRSILDYLTHTKLTHAINRNLLLIATMTTSGSKGGRVPKPEEYVRVYDILLQHVSELGEIPEVSEDMAVKMANTARTFAFKAYRCFHLAESYVSMKKWPEAVGLFDRALEHVAEAVDHYREVGAEKVDQSHVTELQKLQETIRGRKCEVHVNSILETHELEDKMSNLRIASKPLTERLDDYMVTPPNQKITLAPFPPEYRPIPCKPLFFDLALNHIELPSLSHRVEKKPGGITGFMKGLIWGSKT